MSRWRDERSVELHESASGKQRQDQRHRGVPTPSPRTRSSDPRSTRGTTSPVDASRSERVPSDRERGTSRLAPPPIWSDSPYAIPSGASPSTIRRTSPMETRSASSITTTSEIPPPGQPPWLPALKNRRTTEGPPTSGSWALMGTGTGTISSGSSSRPRPRRSWHHRSDRCCYPRWLLHKGRVCPARLR